MSDAKKANSKVVAYATVAIAVLCSALYSFLGTDPATQLLATYVLIGASFWFATWLAILFHELGHVVFGWARGLRVYRLVVWGSPIYAHPLFREYDCEHHSYVVHLKRGATAQDLRWGVVGGPLASLFAGSGFLAFGVLGFPSLSADSLGWLSLLAIVVGLVNFATVWFGLMARDSPGSDGHMLAQLRSDPELFVNWHRYDALFYLIAEQRPRDISEDLFVELSENPLVPTGFVNIHWFWSLFDLGNTVEAQIPLERAYEWAKQQEACDEYVVSAFYEMSMYAARFMQDRSLSDEAFSRGEEADPAHYNRFGALIAREYVWGSKEKALELAESVYAERAAGEAYAPWLTDHYFDWYKTIVPELQRS